MKCLAVFSTFHKHCQGSSVVISEVIPMVKSIIDRLESMDGRGVTGLLSLRFILLRLMKFYFLGGNQKRQYPKVTASPMHLASTAIDPRFRSVSKEMRFDVSYVYTFDFFIVPNPPRACSGKAVFDPNARTPYCY